jgi:hypothetical protein
VRNTIARLLTLLVCLIPLHATNDRPCRSGDFQFSAEPAKLTLVKGEPVTIRLSFTNLTSRAVYIIPYLYPFDFWVDKHRDGHWKTLATGVVGPNVKERIHAGETVTTHFYVDLSSITKSVSGTFRLGAVRAHVYESDSGAKDFGCALFTARSVPFTVQ